MIKIYLPKSFQEINLYSAEIIFNEIFGITYNIETHTKIISL